LHGRYSTRVQTNNLQPKSKFLIAIEIVQCALGGNFASDEVCHRPRLYP
jgi:hypothetical protein